MLQDLLDFAGSIGSAFAIALPTLCYISGSACLLGSLFGIYSRGNPTHTHALTILDDLSARRVAAIEKIGTYYPRRLRHAVSTLAPHHMLKRQSAASGLRILPVAAWRERHTDALSTLLSNRNRAP